MMDPQRELAPISGLSPSSSLSYPDTAPPGAPAPSDPAGGPADGSDIQNQKYQQQYVEDLQKQIEALNKKMEEELARGDVESAKQTQTLLEILMQLLGAEGLSSGENSAGAAPGAGGSPGAEAPAAPGNGAPRGPQPAGTPGANRLRKSVDNRLNDPAPEYTVRKPKNPDKKTEDPLENKVSEKKKNEHKHEKTHHDHDSEDRDEIIRRRKRQYLRDVFGHDISGIHRADPDGEKKSWTVMLYNAASDGNIDVSMLNQLKELRGIGNLENINVVVQQTSSTGFLDSSKPYATRTFALKDGQLQEVKDPQTGRDMSSPGSLKDFLKWGMKNYEADHYAVIMGGHGAGILGAMENKDGNRLMSPEGIRKALEEAKEANGGKKLDMVGFDSCYMGSYEVAHQLKNTADYIVSSEETIGGKGLDYRNILQGIDKNAGGSLHDPRAFVEQFVNASSENDAVKTLSAVDTSSLHKLDRRLSQLAKVINDRDRVPDGDFKKFVNALKGQDLIGQMDENPLFDQFHDMADIARAAQISGNRHLIQSGDLLSRDLKDAVVANYRADDYEGASGLTLFLPLEKLNMETDTSIIYGYDGARDLRSSRLYDYARKVNSNLNNWESLPGWQTTVVPGQEHQDNVDDPRWNWPRPDDPRRNWLRPDADRMTRDGTG
ncbi:MAG: hypothetical protein HYU64_08670 [Armatimonadetes bacterium]|nr:hypothetical protein [Armatimonadota bacterium]